MSSPTMYLLIARHISELISSHFSGGTRSNMGRNGVATARACSQTSSAVPGHVHETVRVSSSTRSNPARRNAEETARLRILERVLIRRHQSATNALVYHSHRA